MKFLLNCLAWLADLLDRDLPHDRPELTPEMENELHCKHRDHNRRI
jgi:hypothetical protein